mgnify:CR=1 FL=1
MPSLLPVFVRWRNAWGFSLKDRVMKFAKPLRFSFIAVCLAAFASCVYDPNARCGENQQFVEDACVCVNNAALTSLGCVSCGENEMSTGSACSCVAGYERVSAGAACTALTSKLGVACDTGNAPCTDPKYSVCHVVSGTAGYCTEQGCSDANPCSGSYACDTNATPTFCRRPPVGVGKTCSSDADCATTEATFCEVFQTHQCLVQSCTSTPNSCFPGQECCTIAPLKKSLCLPPGGCAQAGGSQ